MLTAMSAMNKKKKITCVNRNENTILNYLNMLAIKMNMISIIISLNAE